jgi:hypothetical protein
MEKVEMTYQAPPTKELIRLLRQIGGYGNLPDTIEENDRVAHPKLHVLRAANELERMWEEIRAMHQGNSALDCRCEDCAE